GEMNPRAYCSPRRSRYSPERFAGHDFIGAAWLNNGRMVLKIIPILVGGVIATTAAILAGMITFGTASPPPTLASMTDPFEGVDYGDLPPLEIASVRRGSPIAFRRWQPAGNADLVVILIHGSAMSSTYLHPLGKAICSRGIPVYAPDIRGHGKTGRKGDIDYAGQLDDDLEDFVSMVKAREPNAQLVLAGFSAGGSFALHAAALPIGRSIARLVLISPQLGLRAPTAKSRAWAKPFIPRITALLILDRIGLHAFDYLPV